MKNYWLYKTSSILFIIVLTFTLIGQTSFMVAARPGTAINNKVLIANKAIAGWSSEIPNGEKRPVVVFLPGWGGSGSVNAGVSGQNSSFINEGYITLSIGFDEISPWVSDISARTLQGLDALCGDSSIPANCNAIILVGSSYGGAQNYWVMEYLHSNGYQGRALGFLSEDAGYAAPGYITDNNTGAFTRTGLADTASYSIAMIENLGDTTFPVDECTWGNCGARELSNAHLARGDDNVFSVCPSGGEHGTRGYVDWNAWVISAIKTMLHVTHGVPVFTGYTNPTLSVGNTCVTKVWVFDDVPTLYWANNYIERLYSAGVTGGCSTVPLNYCPDSTVTREQMAVFLLKSMYGSNYVPPAVNGSTGFTDVAADYWAAAWIKQLAAEGITSGCGPNIYCPDSTVTRAQMAIFLLKAKHGAAYVPVNAGGIFTDVPVGYWADKWIEQLSAEGVTSGCGNGNYCPDNSVTRAEMAVFIVRAFNLP